MKKRELRKNKLDRKVITSRIILSLFILGIIIVLAGTVLAQTSNPWNIAFDPIKNMFSQWGEGDLSRNITKYLLWGMLTIVIWAVASSIPGFEKMFEPPYGFVGVLFSILAGFLAMAWLTPADVITIMTSWSALGFTLSIFIPALILFGLTAKIGISRGQTAAEMAWRSLLLRAIWLVYIIFIMHRFLLLWSGGDNASGWYWGPMIAILIVSLFMLFFGIRIIQRLIGREYEQMAKDNYKRNREISTAVIQADSDAARDSKS